MTPQIDGYLLQERLGRGASGEVWRARHLVDDREIALKILHRKPSAKSISERYWDREVLVLKALDHPGIARLMDYCPGPRPYIGMELIEGPDMAKFIGARTEKLQPFSVQEIHSLIRSIADAIAHAHAHGVVHRDLKPQNIIIAKTGPSIVDFGLVRLTHTDASDATTIGRSMGSPLYMAPEQSLGQHASEASDQFSLASIAYEVITQHRAWARDKDGAPATAFDMPLRQYRYNARPDLVDHIRSGPRPQPTRYRPELSSEIDVVIARGCAIDPEDRFESVLQFAQALEDSLHIPEQARHTAVMRRRTESSPVQEATVRRTADDRPPDLAPTTPMRSIPVPASTPWRMALIAGLIATAGILLIAISMSFETPAAVPASTTEDPKPTDLPRAMALPTAPALSPPPSPALPTTPTPVPSPIAAEKRVSKVRRSRPAPQEPAPKRPKESPVGARLKTFASKLKSSQSRLPSSEIARLERRYLGLRARWDPKADPQAQARLSNEVTQLEAALRRALKPASGQ